MLTLEAGSIPIEGLERVPDNILLLEVVEQGAERRRHLSVLKTRDSESDPFVHALEITGGGLNVTSLAPAPGSEGGA